MMIIDELFTLELQFWHRALRMNGKT
jgi:hypothetical protein